VQTGDDCYVVVLSRGHLSGTAYPTVTDDDTGGNSWNRLTETAANRKCTLWHKKATGSTASKTVTVAGCVDSSAGGLSAYSGGHAISPTTNLAGQQNLSGTETHPGFTPDSANSEICLVVCTDNDTTTITAQACTDPGSLGERWEMSSTGGSDCSASLASATQTGGPTATGNFTWTQTDTVSHSIAWAIRPASGAAVTMGDLPPVTVRLSVGDGFVSILEVPTTGPPSRTSLSLGISL
jgi:hypothetical protein